MIVSKLYKTEEIWGYPVNVASVLPIGQPKHDKLRHAKTMGSLRPIYTCQYIVMKLCRHWFIYVPPNSNWPFRNFVRDVCISILNPLRQDLEVFLSTSWQLRSWCNPGIYRLSGQINKNCFKIWYRYASIYWYRYASINGSRGGSIFVKILNFLVDRKIDVCMTSWQYIDAYR